MMMKMKSEAAMIVAVLHDVVEDSGWTSTDLINEGFSQEVIYGLDCVTDRHGESYANFRLRALRLRAFP